jgi:hypothetical protein
VGLPNANPATGARGARQLDYLFSGENVAAANSQTFRSSQVGHAAARDSAVMCSLALQFGAPVETIHRALLRDAHGVAASPLGRALDLFVGSAP